MPRQIQHSQITEQGPKHRTNDDSFLVAPELRLYIVCDGVSGHAGGNVASKLAAETVIQTVRRKIAGSMPNPTIQEAALLARDAILKASQAVFEKASSDPALHKMATTLVLVWQVGEHLLCAHTGDSRVYLWRRGVLQRLTKDHSFVQEMIDSGSMTEEQAKKSPYAHALVHAIGIQATARVDLLAPEVQEGDVVLVCSDGIYGGCSDEHIATALDRASGNLTGTASELVKKARIGGSTDDATAILLEIGLPVGATPPRPPQKKETPPPPLAASPPPFGTTPPGFYATPPPLGVRPPPLATDSSGNPLPQEKLHALDLSPCFGELSFADKTRLLEIARQRRLAPGDILAREGENADKLWVLISGKVRISERGIVVFDRKGPLTLGEAALMDQEPRSASITVIEDAHILEFERLRLLNFFGPHMRNPAAQVYRAIATLEHKRMRELTQQLTEKSAPPSL